MTRSILGAAVLVTLAALLEFVQEAKMARVLPV